MDQGFGRIPTILLTGFLGAGKTTLLNRLIKHYQSRRTVLLLNEFGTVGIDGDLLVEGTYEKVELNRGSLFCICVRTDFIAEVERIATQIRPELLLIEATGIADTSEMEKMLALPNLKNRIKLHVCVCLVDCQNFLKLIEVLEAPASQVRSADIVLVNKTDLVSPEQVNAVITAVRDISPDIQVVSTTYADFPLTMLDTRHHPESHITGVPGDGRPDPVFSLTLEENGSFTPARWEQFQRMLEPLMLRVKGFVSIAGQSYHVDATSAHWSLSKRAGSGKSVNRLVVIGQTFDRNTIHKHFQEALGL